MKRTIIINWRWTSSSEKKHDILKIGEDEVIFCWYNGEAEKTGIEKIIKPINTGKILVLLHRDNNILSKDLSDPNITTVDFSGGDEVVYDAYGGFIHTGKYFLNIEESFRILWNDPVMNLNRFRKVWKHYFIEKPIIEHKKTLINLWLPLAIDIQGLSEVKEDSVKNEYYMDIKKEKEYLNSLGSFPKPDEFPQWEEIIRGVESDYKNFNPVKLVTAIQNNIYNDFDGKYFKDYCFLPNWLREVVKSISG